MAEIRSCLPIGTSSKTPSTVSYASVAAQSVSSSISSNSNRDREVTVRAADPEAGATDSRSNAEIVAAVNSVHGAADAIVARKLPSGDWRVTFQTPAIAAARTRLSSEWVPKVHPIGALVRRTWQVVASGFKIDQATQHDPEELGRLLSQQNIGIHILRAKIPRNAENKKTTSIYLSVETAAMANRLCEQGLLWEYSLHECTPFCDGATIRQCYKCKGFGHPARYCPKVKAVCGWCASTSHDENDCISKRDRIDASCTNCKGDHPSFDRNCPSRLQAQARAKVAYANRPRRYPITEPIRPNAEIPSPSIEPEWIDVTSKRRRAPDSTPRRGRPLGSTNAARNNMPITAFLGNNPLPPVGPNPNPPTLAIPSQETFPSPSSSLEELLNNAANNATRDPVDTNPTPHQC